MNMGNIARQYYGQVAWDGAAPGSIDIRNYVNFAFSFEVLVDLANDTFFNVEAAPPSDADVCVAGTFVPVPEVLTCVADWGAVGAPQAQLMLPTGTVAGSKCSATIPCKPDAFVRIVGGGGDVGSVRAVAILGGPK